MICIIFGRNRQRYAHFAVMLNMADAVLSASAEKNISSSERGGPRRLYSEEFAGA